MLTLYNPWMGLSILYIYSSLVNKGEFLLFPNLWVHRVLDLQRLHSSCQPCHNKTNQQHSSIVDSNTKPQYFVSYIFNFLIQPSLYSSVLVGLTKVLCRNGLRSYTWPQGHRTCAMRPNCYPENVPLPSQAVLRFCHVKIHLRCL